MSSRICGDLIMQTLHMKEVALDHTGMMDLRENAAHLRPEQCIIGNTAFSRKLTA